MNWIPADYLWIIVFLLTVWTLTLVAPIHFKDPLVSKHA